MDDAREALSPEVRTLADRIASQMPDEFPYGYAVHLAKEEIGEEAS